MDNQRFDEIALALATVPTRRRLLGRMVGGSLAALLAVLGIGGIDEAEAKNCR